MNNTTHSTSVCGPNSVKYFETEPYICAYWACVYLLYLVITSSQLMFHFTFQQNTLPISLEYSYGMPHLFLHQQIPIVTVEWVAFLLLQVPSSNLSSETGYTKLHSSWFFSVFPARHRYSISHITGWLKPKRFWHVFGRYSVRISARNSSFLGFLQSSQTISGIVCQISP
jgi:hypothetical protein